MPREYRLYLKDIRTAAERIDTYTKELDLESFRASPMVIDAVLRNFTIIGEAAKNIPVEIRERYADVPWRAAASFRDLLAHEYFRVDLEQTWDIIHNHLPALSAQIADILQQEADK